MTTRVQREIASTEAAFGAAVADLAALLESAGHPTPYDVARGYVEELHRAGWRWRLRDLPPSRPPMTAHIPAAEHDGWRRWREKARADMERSRSEFEAREQGRTPDPATARNDERTNR